MDQTSAVNDKFWLCSVALLLTAVEKNNNSEKQQR